jgi:tetratricopeptide (TPR) repeat protein
MVRAQLQLNRGDAQGALDTVVWMEKRIGEHPDIHCLGGLALLLLSQSPSDPKSRQSHLDAAVDAFQATLKQEGVIHAERSMSHPGALARIGLGTVELQRGAPAKALRHFESALRDDPSSKDGLLGKAEALSALGRVPEALKTLGTPDENGPDSWLVAAAAAERLGRCDDLQVFLERASVLAVRGGGYRFLHHPLEQAGLACRLSAYLGEPLAGPGASGAACAILVGAKPERPPQPLDPHEHAELRLLVDNLLHRSQDDFLERLCTPDAEAKLPGLQDILAEAVVRGRAALAAVAV